MSKPLLLSLGSGKVQELVGTATSQVPVWDNTLSEWQAAAVPGGGGGGGVTSVGLTGGTSGLVIGGDSSPITSTGTFQLNSPQRFQFDTSADFAPTAVGQLSWNAAEGSLNTLMVGGNVDAIVGQQLYQRAVNGDTVTLTKGMVVYVYGSSGTRVQVKRALANADLTSATILGVVAESISVSQEGFIITAGKLGNLSVLPSTTFADGDVVYLSASTPGGLTPTRPTAPQHGVMVGYCVKASNGSAGVLVVHPQNGYELGELHDVLISSPTSGQILVYDATAGQTRWENATPTGSSGVVVTPGAGSLAFSLDSAYAPTFLGLALSGLSASQFVKTDASKNLVSQQFVALGSEVSGTLPAANGGTSFSTYATGDLIYASAANTLAKRSIGSTGDVLTVSAGGVPTWAAPATSGTVTNVSTVTTGMGLTLAVTNPTTTPTLTLAGTLATAHGGTGIDASSANGVLVFLDRGRERGRLDRDGGSVPVERWRVGPADLGQHSLRYRGRGRGCAVRGSGRVPLHRPAGVHDDGSSTERDRDHGHQDPEERVRRDAARVGVGGCGRRHHGQGHDSRNGRVVHRHGERLTCRSSTFIGTSSRVTVSAARSRSTTST
jgi:hypothetical protein